MVLPNEEYCHIQPATRRPKTHASDSEPEANYLPSHEEDPLASLYKNFLNQNLCERGGTEAELIEPHYGENLPGDGASGSSTQRSFCVTCHKAAPVCICSRFQEKVQNSIGITILQDPKEKFHPLGSARIALLGLENVRLIVVPPGVGKTRIMPKTPGSKRSLAGRYGKQGRRFRIPDPPEPPANGTEHSPATEKAPGAPEESVQVPDPEAPAKGKEHRPGTERASGAPEKTIRGPDPEGPANGKDGKEHGLATEQAPDAPEDEDISEQEECEALEAEERLAGGSNAGPWRGEACGREACGGASCLGVDASLSAPSGGSSCKESGPGGATSHSPGGAQEASRRDGAGQKKTKPRGFRPGRQWMMVPDVGPREYQVAPGGTELPWWIDLPPGAALLYPSKEAIDLRPPGASEGHPKAEHEEREVEQEGAGASVGVAGSYLGSPFAATCLPDGAHPEPDGSEASEGGRSSSCAGVDDAPAACQLASLPAQRWPAGRAPSHLIVLDGTWPKAKRIYHQNPWLHALPHYKLPPSEPSHYGFIRRQPKLEFLSTVESIVYALRALEPETPGFGLVLSVFDSMVDDQVRYMKEHKKGPFGEFQGVKTTLSRNGHPILDRRAASVDA
eukprot:jgi/Mesen1/9065/ME000578S08303